MHLNILNIIYFRFIVEFFKYFPIFFRINLQHPKPIPYHFQDYLEISIFHHILISIVFIHSINYF